LVLCAIHDQDEYKEALDRMCGAVVPGGRLILAFCNPYMTFHGDTVMQLRLGPSGAIASADDDDTDDTGAAHGAWSHWVMVDQESLHMCIVIAIRPWCKP
jgi:hypothetical protein